MSSDKWKKVGDIALLAGDFSLAEKCFTQAQDFNSLLLFYSSYGDQTGLQRVVEEAEATGKYNVAFEAAFLLGHGEKCIELLLKAKKVAEAAMMARAYCPSQLDQLTQHWEELLKLKGLPFQPENILKHESTSEIL